MNEVSMFGGWSNWDCKEIHNVILSVETMYKILWDKMEQVATRHATKEDLKQTIKHLYKAHVAPQCRKWGGDIPSLTEDNLNELTDFYYSECEVENATI